MREIAAAKNVNGLTAKQEAFAQAVVSGKPYAEAYKGIYNTTANDNVVRVNAAKLAANANVALRIKELQRENENMSIWTRKDALEMLLRAASVAEDCVQEPVMGIDPNGKPVVVGYKYNAGAGNVIVKAVEAASKMCGYNEPETTENKVEIIIGGSADEYAE